MSIQESGMRNATFSDKAAIAELQHVFNAQGAAFALDRAPGLKERQDRLGKLCHMMLSYRERISAALTDDFGCHPIGASDLIEVLGPVARAQHAMEHLEGWMRPDMRPLDAAMMGSARAYIQHQPKGVVGNIVPWNFPFDLGIGPLVEMLAAGNRVIIKPSEYTPNCALLLRDMIASTFDPTLVYIAVGGLDLARAFAQIPWDHLLYTGSTRVGREIMQAAARNLTPVTLELGGKCPALLTPGAVNSRNLESIIGTKTVKNGQMCISVDYCLVARAEVDAFAELAVKFLQRVSADYSRSADCTGIISTHHFERLSAMLEEARARGCKIVELEPGVAADSVSRRMPISLVIDPPDDLQLMKEEIFGPLLPVVPYDDLDSALSKINCADRPLGAYLFGDDPSLIDRLLSQIVSGGAAVNTCAIQGALPSLGFGGVGMSGMGRHHGIEGFKEFSNPRGVVVRGTGDQFDAFCAPYAKAAAIVRAALGTAAD